jgi:hypothetical protein
MPAPQGFRRFCHAPTSLRSTSLALQSHPAAFMLSRDCPGLALPVLINVEYAIAAAQ